MHPIESFLAGVQARALRIAELSLRDRDDALDVVQDAMLKFVSNYAEKPEQEWPPLFYRILYNRITDIQRSRKTRGGLFSSLFATREDGADLDQKDYMADARPTDPARLGDAERFADALETALQALPERQRQAFLMREWEGLDVASFQTSITVLNELVPGAPKSRFDGYVKLLDRAVYYGQEIPFKGWVEEWRTLNVTGQFSEIRVEYLSGSITEAETHAFF